MFIGLNGDGNLTYSHLLINLLNFGVNTSLQSPNTSISKKSEYELFSDKRSFVTHDRLKPIGKNNKTASFTDK